jgi:hypothetical protein
LRDAIEDVRKTTGTQLRWPTCDFNVKWVQREQKRRKIDPNARRLAETEKRHGVLRAVPSETGFEPADP